MNRLPQRITAVALWWFAIVAIVSGATHESRVVCWTLGSVGVLAFIVGVGCWMGRARGGVALDQETMRRSARRFDEPHS